MKNLTMKMMVAAAALVVAGGVASAQVMTAEIPFRFQAAGAWLEPGTYSINHISGSSATTTLRPGRVRARYWSDRRVMKSGAITTLAG